MIVKMILNRLIDNGGFTPLANKIRKSYPMLADKLRQGYANHSRKSFERLLKTWKYNPKLKPKRWKDKE